MRQRSQILICITVVISMITQIETAGCRNARYLQRANSISQLRPLASDESGRDARFRDELFRAVLNELSMKHFRDLFKPPYYTVRTEAGTFVIAVASEVLGILREVLHRGDYVVDLGSGGGHVLAIAAHLGAERCFGYELNQGLIGRCGGFLEEIQSRMPGRYTEFRRDKIEIIRSDFVGADLASVDGRIPVAAQRVYFYYIEGSRALKDLAQKREFIRALRALPPGSLVIFYSLGHNRDFTDEELLRYFGNPVRVFRHEEGFYTHIYWMSGTVPPAQPLTQDIVDVGGRLGHAI